MYWKASTSLTFNSDMALISDCVKNVMHSWAKTELNPIQEYPLVMEWGMYQSTEKSERHQAHFYSLGSGGGEGGVVVTDK